LTQVFTGMMYVTVVFLVHVFDNFGYTMSNCNFQYCW